MFLRISLVFILLILQGCAGYDLREKAPPRYFWPRSEQDAKIEYLGFYASEGNFKEVLFSELAEIVFGVEPVKPLFHTPFAVDAWQRRVAVCDSGLRVVFAIDLERGKIEKISPPLAEGKTTGVPLGVAILDDKRFLVTDTIGAKIDIFSFAGEHFGSFGKGLLTRPTGVTIDRRQQRTVVVDTGGHRLALFDRDSRFVGYIGAYGQEPGQFNFPLDADFDRDGNLYVLDSMNFRVQRFVWDGQNYVYAMHFGELGSAAGSFSRPKSLAVSSSGHVYVTDALANKVVVFDRDGTFLLNFGGKFIAAEGKVAPGGFYMPNGIAVDDQERIWVVDSLNRMIHHFQYLNQDYLRVNPIVPGELDPH